MKQTIDKFLKVQLDGRGSVYLQVLDDRSPYGFYVTDGDSVWAGGLNMPSHSYLQVTRRHVPRLDWIQNMIQSGIAEPCFSRYALLYFGFTLPVYLKLYEIDYPRFKR
jgi:hypothetical protein